MSWRVIDAKWDETREAFRDFDPRAVAEFGPSNPGWLERLLTTPVPGLASYEQMLRELTENRDAIKVFVEVA